MNLPRVNSRSLRLRSLSPALIAILLFLLTLPAHAQLTFSPNNLSFGKVLTGQSRTLQLAMTNTSSRSITITGDTNPSGFTVENISLPFTLGPGGTAHCSVMFAPSTVGQLVENIAFTTNGSGSPSLQVRGTGIGNWSVSLNPASLGFGNVPVGSSATLPVALTNMGSSSAVISQQYLQGSGFSFTGLSLPLVLGKGQSYTFNVTYSPQGAGSASGDIWLSNPGNPTLLLPLSATGTTAGALSVSPTTLSFGKVTDGTTETLNATLTATGASVTVSSASSNSSEFVFGGLALPFTIAAGQSVSFSVAFTPQTSGAASGSVSFTSNASGSAPAEGLTGTGVAPQTYSVTLSWNASNPPVTGYNVYRGNTNGGPYSKIYSLDPSTSYTDSTVSGNETYYYVTTAVNSSGEESAYSNQVQVAIP